MPKEQILEKREKEFAVVSLMIELYCKGNHKEKNVKFTSICPECAELNEYVYKRIQNCPFMETKTFCNLCKVHCYKTEQREKIKMVMRYSGPRMLFHHPVLAIKHLVLTIKEKNRQKKNSEEK